MHSLQQIARDAAGVSDTSNEEVFDAGKQIAVEAIKVDWLQHEVTKQMLNSLSIQIEELETRARQLACNYHIHNNHLEIVNLLVRASELRKLKQTAYGK